VSKDAREIPVESRWHLVGARRPAAVVGQLGRSQSLEIGGGRPQPLHAAAQLRIPSQVAHCPLQHRAVAHPQRLQDRGFLSWRRRLLGREDPIHRQSFDGLLKREGHVRLTLIDEDSHLLLRASAALLLDGVEAAGSGSQGVEPERETVRQVGPRGR